MRNLMRTLFGVESIDEFFEQVPNVSVVTRFSQDQNFGVKTVNVRDAIFNWYFDPKHAFVDIESHYLKTDPIITQFMNQYGQLFIYNDMFQTQVINNSLFSLLMLYRDRMSLFDSLVTEFNTKKFPAVYQRHVAFIVLDSAYRRSRIEFVSSVLNNAYMRGDVQLFGFVHRVIKKIEEDIEDQKYYGVLITYLLATSALDDTQYPHKSELEKIIREGITRIKNDFPEYLPEVVDAIVSHQREAFYGVLKKNYNFTVAQLQQIVSRKISKLYDHVRDYLKKVQTPLNSDDTLLIAEIYKNKITDFDVILNENLDEATRAALQSTKE